MSSLRSYKTILAWFILFSGSTCDVVCQNSKQLPGKYCEDLGFGWYCIDFQKDGNYTEISGHSSRSYKIKGAWFYRNDTIMTIPVKKRKMETDTSYYIVASDSLYSIYFNHKTRQMSRSKPLIKQ